MTEQEVKKNQESDHWRIFNYSFPRVYASLRLSNNEQNRGRKQANKKKTARRKENNWTDYAWIEVLLKF